ncbi:terminase gpA endonuclease subunit [Algicola sagamiensis]|uniref:terminase gpA endonuclease subunit n=1 Tax=Algicola sagamiensis TaxID=163869 RepID=UPI00037ECA0A|nr:terminase gpA endonuclease subunit [Algicola sagamiensis]
MPTANAKDIIVDLAEILQPSDQTAVSQGVMDTVYTKDPAENWIPWQLETAPYMVEPLDLVTSRRHRGLIFVGPARSGKSNALIQGVVGYTAKCNPRDTLIVHTTKDKAAELSRKDIEPMFRHSPALAPMLSTRANDNNTLRIILKNGAWIRFGYPTKAIFASSSWPQVLITDYDREAKMLNVGGEGDGFALACKRTQTFRSRGITVAESSPGYEVLDPDWEPDHGFYHEAPPTLGVMGLYNLGDRRVLYWPCPHCKEYFPARFEYLRWDTTIENPKAASESVTMQCPCCERDDIYPSDKFAMTQAARWVPQGCTIDPDGTLHGASINTDYASFWMEGPAASFQSWQQLVYQYLIAKADFEATGSEEKFKTTINVDQGRPYQSINRQRKDLAGELQARVCEQAQKTVPQWVRFLTAAVDVQGGSRARFSILVMGWGPELEHTVIDRFEIEASKRPGEQGKFKRINPGSYLEDWDLLHERVLLKRYRIEETDARMQVLLTACDTGGENETAANAYDYYRKLKQHGLSHKLMLIKGRANQNDYVAVTYPDNTKRKDRTQKARGDVPLFLLASNALKDVVANSLERDEPGPKYCHFPNWLPEAFFEELTAEERDVKGRWNKVKAKAPNEALDQFYYCWGMIYKIQAHNIRWDNPPPWAASWETNPRVVRDGQTSATMVPKRRRYVFS